MVVAIAWPADAVRFQDRGMYINSARGGDTTFYVISLRYTTPASVGSLVMEFCDNPIPSLPCTTPPGLDVSGATLAAQTGETGFSIDAGTHDTNTIILTRTPAVTGVAQASYRFDNIVNPSDDHQDFYVRMTSHTSSDGTGPIIDYGSVTNTTTPEVGLFTQVPPILTFCVAEQINDDECTDTEGTSVDFGELEPTETYSATSEMQAYTNAPFGYSIAVYGTTMTSGIRAIPALEVPTESFQGVGQFGLNLAVNSSPNIGAAPVGPGTNAVLNPIYDQPNKFLLNSGDVLVTSDNVTLTKKFTTAYILNVPADQAPGVYSTTITYVCTGNF